MIVIGQSEVEIISLSENEITVVFPNQQIQILTIGEQGLPGANGVGVPPGGSAGQVLEKIDGADYNTQWSTPAPGGVTRFNGRTGAVLPASGDYSINQITGAATVAATGDYSDLLNTPTLLSQFTNDVGFITGISWGDITGTLSNQSDLQSALNGKQPLDATLTALASYNTNGFLVQTAADTFAGRSLTAPAAGLTISNNNGVSGNPTFALANDLAALEGLSSTGIAVRTASDTWAQRTITGTTNQVTVTNGNGVSGNPALSLPQNIHTGASPTFTGLTLSGLTAGSVLFSGSGGVISQDNTNFNYNDSTDTLTVKNLTIGVGAAGHDPVISFNTDNRDGTITYDNTGGSWSFKNATGGTTVTLDTLGTAVSNFLLIFDLLVGASALGMSGNVGSLVVESRSPSVGLGSLVLFGYDPGTTLDAEDIALSTMYFWGNQDNNLGIGAGIIASTAEDWSTGGTGANLLFTVTPVGEASAPIPKLGILGAGGVLVFDQLGVGDILTGDPSDWLGLFPYTSAPSPTLETDQYHFCVYDNGSSPVFRITYNDGGVTKTGDVALA